MRTTKFPRLSSIAHDDVREKNLSTRRQVLITLQRYHRVADGSGSVQTRGGGVEAGVLYAQVEVA